MMLGYPKYRFHRVPKRDAVKVTWRERPDIQRREPRD